MFAFPLLLSTPIFPLFALIMAGFRIAVFTNFLPMSNNPVKPFRKIRYFCQFIIALEACRFGWILYTVQLDMMQPCSIRALFIYLLPAIRRTNEPCIWQHPLKDQPSRAFISDSCICISCVCGSHRQDGNKASRKIRLLGMRRIAQLQCLDRSLLRRA